MDKPLALLIPGLDGTGRLFQRQTGPLSEKYRVLPWEFRRRGSFDLPDLAKEVAEAAEKEPQESVLVVAESFGGMVAMQLALDFSIRIQRLVLINTFPVYRQGLRIRLACRLSGLLQMPSARSIKEFVVDRVLRREGIPEHGRRLYRDTIRSVHYPAYCRRLELVRDVDLRPRLKEISIPTLLFASGTDKLVPSIAEARFMHSVLPNSTVYEFPNAGHALLLTPGFTLAEYL